MNVVHLPLRGQLRNPAHALIERDFSGLCWGKITPTDIDLFLDFGNTLFVFCEAKLHGTDMRTGQRIAFERLCDACDAPPRRFSLGCLVAHDGMPRFDYAKAEIVSCRWRGHWYYPKHSRQLREFIDAARRYAYWFPRSQLKPQT